MNTSYYTIKYSYLYSFHFRYSLFLLFFVTNLIVNLDKFKTNLGK